MLMPIVTNRNTTGPGDDAAQGIRRSPLPAGQRGEAIQKILDALGRHLSGEAVLSRDALVQMFEDLSQLLKSSALPQENGRAIARRLIELIESLPLPERLAVERELGGRGPAQRIAVAARSIGTASTGAMAMAAPPLPTERTAIRHLPLQASVPAQTFAAQVPTSGDLALLQAMLKKTFGAEEEAAKVEQTLEDRPEAEPDAKTRTDASRASNAGEGRARPPANTHNPATFEIAPGLAEDGTAGAEATLRTLPEAPEGAPRADAAKAGSLPPATAGGEASGSKAPTEEASKNADRTSGAAATEDSADASADGWDSDGTYGPPRPKGENDRQQARPAAARLQVAAPRALADIIKALASDGFGAPERASGSGGPKVREPIEDARLPAPSEPAAPEHTLDAALRPRNAASGAQLSADPAAAEPPDAAAPGIAPSSQQRTRQPGEDPAMQQAIALLVESGLPKEIIPFALAPYPPSQTESESRSDDAEQHRPDDHEGEAETGSEDDKGEREQYGGGDGDVPEEPDAADAYDLYRKLGGLG